MLKLAALSIILALSACAEYGGPNSGANGGSNDAGPDAGPTHDPDAGNPEVCPEPEVCPLPEECEEPEVCPEPELCEVCPEPPVSDPCECFNECPGFDTQKCLSDMMRAQGMCTTGYHYDVRFWCKVDGDWRSEKTWVYPCDEPAWYDQ